MLNVAMNILGMHAQIGFLGNQFYYKGSESGVLKMITLTTSYTSVCGVPLSVDVQCVL